MSQRQCIRDLEVNGEADSVFLLGGASLQQSRNGPYWRLELRDAGGAMEAKIWSPLSASFHDLSAGQLAHVRGRVGLFREQLQLTVEDLRVLTDEEAARVDLAEFMPASPRPVPDMMEELDAMIERELTHAPWKLFVRSVLEDERVRLRLPAAPAAKSVHHAYVGGLLEHMLSVAGLCLRMADHYPELDRQMLCAGALLHDIGKLEEMSGGLVNEYTDAGRFLGHIAQGLIMMEPHLAASGLEPALALHFRHLNGAPGRVCWGAPCAGCRARPPPALSETRTRCPKGRLPATVCSVRMIPSPPAGMCGIAAARTRAERLPERKLLPAGRSGFLPRRRSAPARRKGRRKGRKMLRGELRKVRRRKAAAGSPARSAGAAGHRMRRRRTEPRLPAMPGNAPGRAEGRPDRAREKDLTQCSLL